MGSFSRPYGTRLSLHNISRRLSAGLFSIAPLGLASCGGEFQLCRFMWFAVARLRLIMTGGWKAAARILKPFHSI